MAYIEHARDTLTGPITEDYLQERIREGWRPVVVEWQREVNGKNPETARIRVGTPYGLRVADDCQSLERDPAETSVLALMLELIREERAFPEIAETLNLQGFRTRQGTKWTQITVFKLLPRLIDAAPEIRRTRIETVNRDS